MKLQAILETVEDQILNLSKRIKKSPEYITPYVKRIGGKYWKWVLTQWANATIRLPEDEHRVMEALHNFQKQKPTLPNKDINSYKNLHALEQAVDTAHKTKKEKDIVNITREGVKILKEYGNYTVIKITNPEALKDLGEGTKWCTRRSYPQCQAEEYLKDHGSINMVLQEGQPLIQYTADLSQIMDVTDSSIDNIPTIVSGVKAGTLDIFELIIPDYKQILTNLQADETNYYTNSELPIADDQRDSLQIFFELLQKIGYKGQLPHFEKLIYTLLNNNHKYAPWLATTYAKNIKGRWPEIEPYIVDKPISATYYAEHILKRGWPEAEPYILDTITKEDATTAINYASSALKRRWPEAEIKILNKNKIGPILNYAYHVVKNRWPEGETKLLKLTAKDPFKYSRHLVNYAKIAINEERANKIRWPEAEPIILTGNVWIAIDYAQHCTNGWPELEQQLIEKAANTNPDSDSIKEALSYASDVLKRRWPQLEEIFKEYYNNKHRYNLNLNLLLRRIEKYKQMIRLNKPNPTN
jgi:hypothetical protein